MPRWIVPCLLLSILGAAPAAWSGEKPPSAEALEAVRGLARANNAFAHDLYGVLRDGDENVFFSPYSLHVALMMAREGARGKTAEELDRVLHLGGIDRPYALGVRAYYMQIPVQPASFIPGAEARPGYRLDVANALWAQKGYAFQAPFLKLLADDYQAPLERIDFADSKAARARINGWVEEKTQRKIRDIIPTGQPSPLTRLMLANAIYFKAPWQDRFVSGLTKEAPFKGPGGAKTVPLMRKEEKFPYAEVQGVQVLEIPYRTGNVSMVVFLPRAADGLAALEKALCGGKLVGWDEKLEKRLVDAYLPRFEITQGQGMVAALRKVGLKAAFDPKAADFSGMTDQERIFIGGVQHKAFIAVDEKGTEAAAASVMGVFGSDDGPNVKPLVFRADHPFVFVIRHVHTGAILFMGRVVDPGA